MADTLERETAGAAAPDFYFFDELLTDSERAIRDRVRKFCQDEVLPVINDYWERGEFFAELVPKFARLGVAGGTVKGYGCPGLGNVASGIVAAELARADGSLSAFHGVHTCLAMHSIAMLGSEEQRQRWLPSMARLEKLGAFALTEPEHGSDAVRLETRARREGNTWVLDGQKRWIGNGSVADIVVVWARDDNGDVGGFVVEPPDPGYEAEVITGKTAKRALWQADIRLQGVRVPSDHRLEQSHSFDDTNRVLTASRQYIAWEALGHAMGALDGALAYALTRNQFGRPIAGFQLIQDKLARMLADVTSMQLLSLRLAHLQDQGRVTPGMASLAKLQTANASRRVVADARAILGGNGILLEYHVARHHADMEAVYTYEGTDEIQALIVGRELTGLSAFAR